MSARLKWPFSWQNHMKCYKLSQSCVAVQSAWMIACPQGVLQCNRPGTGFLVLPWQWSLHAHTLQSPAKLGMRVSGEISAKLYHTAVHNLSLGQRESRGEIHSVQLNGWERETRRARKRGRGGNYTHTHEVRLHCDKDVYCTFVSRTDMILSLASLTFSLFPHTLMCGSAGDKKKKKKRKRATLKVGET